MRIILTILAALALASCMGKSVPLGGVDGTGAVEVAKGDLPAPESVDMLGQNRPYLIGPFDKLTIDVFGIEELNQKEVQTDASGRISFPLVGVVAASGRTPREVEGIIEQRLRGRYVRNPQVTVNLKETISQKVAVDGEVKEPGLYPVMGRMTLMRAVATAKGVSENAKLNDVVVFRTVNGKKMAALYNLKAIRRGVYEDPEIYANDVVVVGDSPARRIFRDVLQVAPILSYVVVAMLK